MPYEGSYLWQLRQKIGHDKVLVPGVCAIITDGDRVLLEHRRDLNRWGLPGGSCELGESVLESLVREVKEETGLTVEAAELAGLYTGPQYDARYPNGDQVQYFTITFHITRWSGDVARDEAESHDVRWWPLSDLPPLAPTTLERLSDFRQYPGSVIIK